MTNPRYDRPIVKLVALLLIAIIIAAAYRLQCHAFNRGIDGTLLTGVVGLFGIGVGAAVSIALGKRKKH